VKRRTSTRVLSGLVGALAVLVSVAGIAEAQQQQAAWAGFVFGKALGEVPFDVVVRNVAPDSPAAVAGLEVGDGILKVDGAVVASARVVANALRSKKPGQRLLLKVLRGEEELNLSLELAVRDLKALCDHAIEVGAAVLAGRQQADGGWLRKGLSVDEHGSDAAVSGLCLRALAGMSALKGKYKDHYAKGAAFLLSKKVPSGKIVGDPGRQHYSTYATALTLQALALIDMKAHAAGIAELRACLIEEQLDDGEKISEYDFVRHGGWNIFDVNTKATMGTDLSVTSHALEALHLSGGIDPKSKTVQQARVWLDRTQNMPGDEGIPAHFLDGGFSTNPRESKAGRQTLEGGAIVFRPYGSSTSDGLRTLFRVGYGKEDERVQMAVSWIATFFHTGKNPNFPTNVQSGPGGAGSTNDRGIYYYYLNSLSDALSQFGERFLTRADGTEIDWAEQIVRRLVAIQQLDGAWRGDGSAMNEDDPNLATSMAILALERCRPFLDQKKAKK
jgi:hypothetical protein